MPKPMPLSRRLPLSLSPLNLSPLCALAVLVGLHAGGAALAADTPEPVSAPQPTADPLAPARSHIAGQRYAAAVAELKKLGADNNADWNNLMGYALRKQAPPDLAGAQRHYDAALRLNPAHLGALAYSGELALMRSDLPTAEQRLAALNRLCSSPCEALDELRLAITTYKAAGKR